MKSVKQREGSRINVCVEYLSRFMKWMFYLFVAWNSEMKIFYYFVLMCSDKCNLKMNIINNATKYPG